MFSIPTGCFHAKDLPRQPLMARFVVLIGFVAIFFGPNLPCQGQEPNETVDVLQAIELSVSSLEKIQKDYGDFLAKRKRIFDNFQRNQDNLRKTEEDFQRIGNEGVRQQLLAMQSSFQSMQIEGAQREIAEQNRRLPNARSMAMPNLLNQHFNILEIQRAMANLETESRRLELNQLDAAAQATVRRRIECFQNGFALQQEWAQWQQDWLGFMARYWPHSDPERKFTRAEIEARLQVLKGSDPEDFAAILTSALLMERLGLLDEALESIDRVIAAQTALGSTAMYAKGFILYALKRDKDAKTALQAAAKETTKSPYERWIRARIAASRKQLPNAETEWKALLTLKPFEIEARRSLALVHYARLENSARESKKALKEAQLAYDLEPTHDWYSHLVLGLALSAAKMEPEALKQLDQAETKATDENLELCTRVRQAIEQRQVIEWDFETRFGDRKR